jgi:hypothetical protein
MENLDLVMRDNDFVIYHHDQPFLTPGGAEIAHQDSRLLKHLMIKLTLAHQADVGTLNSFSLFSFCKDFLEKGTDPVKEHFDELVSNDPLLKARLNPDRSGRISHAQKVLDDPDGNPGMLNLMFMGASVITRGLRDFLPASTADETIALIREKYDSLRNEKKAAVNLLSAGHRSGILLPMLLVLSQISASEYALAALPAQSGPSGKSFSEVHEHALKTMEFLSFSESPDKKMSVIAELINQGEHDKLEFKSTFRWDIRQAKKNPAIEHAALKSMTAFLNSDGGDLLLGVADDGSIIGVETDAFANDDKFLLHVWNLIKTSIGQDVSPYIKTTLDKIDGKTVCRVSCKRSPKPVFLRQSGFDEMFYIRIGPSSGNLEISEALKYIGERF